jgi:uncharacterized protein DUF4389
MDIKENVKNIDVWTRGLFILVFGVIYYFLFLLILLVVIFQFIMKLLTTELNSQLLDFSDSLTRYVAQILLYVTFKSEERPFPFSPWPGSGESSNSGSNDNTQSKTSKKKTTKKKVTKKESEGGKES